ncbi:MAG: HAD hydrolase-like protein [Desulfobulbaceae bacterium]|nr:HAD hydrolase-like protein [Desulfobulbaceae bacterium]
MKKLILFDIDGTILNFKHGIAKSLFADLISELFGKEVPDSAIPDFWGMTDLQILRIISQNIGVSYDETLKILPTIWSRIYISFEEHTTIENVKILPGVVELINDLHDNPDIQLGLITGNFFENAYLKLRAHNLDKFFPIGAFGSDSDDRNMLPPIAIKRANEFVGSQIFTSNNTLIIGDTPRDIDCAKAHNIAVLCVATGSMTFDELSLLNADFVLNDLSDTTNTLEIINRLIEN